LPLVSKLIFTTLGTLGDLHPMLPVAALMRERGHEVEFVLPPALNPRVVNEGFPSFAVEMMPDPPPQGYRPSASRAKARIEQEYTPFLQSAIGVLSRACADADLLLSTPHQIATAVVGSRLKMPWVTLSVFPGFVPSSYTVPQPHWLPALPTPAGRVVNRFTWWLYAYGLNYLAQDAISAAVGSHGVTMDPRLFAPGAISPHLCIVMSSPAYSPPLPDWPPQVKVTGFVAWDEPKGWQEPPGLAEFLAAGPAPILVTTSTSTERNAAAQLYAVGQAIERLGRRGIILTGRVTKDMLGDRPYVVNPVGIGAWSYLPLSKILPHVEMVVHHSGIGTATATIQHGLPCLAIPAGFDQWYNAGRIRDLGVGRVVKYDGLTVDRIESELRKVLAQPRYRKRAQQLAREMEGEDGAARACDEIEALLDRTKGFRRSA
jgi:UDP:flavonoid glycosyltransferase YjiC (YdhE family)